jgi:hypothetical protein
MTWILIVIVAAIVVGTALAALAIHRRHHSSVGNGSGAVVVAAGRDVAVRESGGSVEFIANPGTAHEFLLVDVRIASEAALTGMSVSLAGVPAFLAHALDNDLVRQLALGSRFAVVRVPSEIASGGRWMTSGGEPVAQAVGAAGAGSRAVLVGGGAAGLVGLAAVGWPVIAAGLAAAWTQRRLETALASIQQRVDRVYMRSVRSEQGDVDAAGEFVSELLRLGPPSEWSVHRANQLAGHQVAVSGIARAQLTFLEETNAAIVASGRLPRKLTDRLGPAEILRGELQLAITAQIAKAQLANAVGLRSIALGETASGFSELRLSEDSLHSSIQEIRDCATQLAGHPAVFRLTGRREVKRFRELVLGAASVADALLPQLPRPSQSREFAVLVQREQLELRALLPGASQGTDGLETE